MTEHFHKDMIPDEPETKAISTNGARAVASFTPDSEPAFEFVTVDDQQEQAALLNGTDTVIHDNELMGERSTRIQNKGWKATDEELMG